MPGTHKKPSKLNDLEGDTIYNLNEKDPKGAIYFQIILMLF